MIFSIFSIFPPGVGPIHMWQ